MKQGAAESRKRRRAEVRDRRRRAAKAGAALAAFLGLQPSDARADTFTVTNLSNSGAGSLRQAIDDANANAGADSIVFQAGLTGTIVESSLPQLVITESVEILGPGADQLTIDAQNRVRVFYLLSSSEVSDITISGLTLANGNSQTGGAVIDWGENLTIEQCVISGNVATGGAGGGAIYVGYQNAAVTIRDTTISGNHSEANAGAIYLYGGGLTIEQSTLSGNDAAADGGAVSILQGTLTVNGSTIAGNTAVGSGGGLNLAGGTATLRNTIVANDSAAAAADISGTLNADYCLIEDATGAAITGAHNVTGQDPVLGSLANNGGTTRTMLPGDTSPVIDAGDPAFSPPPSTDQRGMSRVSGGRLDMGAVEVQQAPPPPPTTAPSSSFASEVAQDLATDCASGG